MIALETFRRRVCCDRIRHVNSCVRWKPDRMWLMSALVTLVIFALVSICLRWVLWYSS